MSGYTAGMRDARDAARANGERAERIETAARALFWALCADDAYCDQAGRDDRTQQALSELGYALGINK